MSHATPQHTSLSLSELELIMKSFQIGRSTGSDSDGRDRIHDQPLAVISSKVVAIAESLEKRERSRFVTSQVPTDLTIQVNDISFHVHKSKCGYMREVDLQASNSNMSWDLKMDNFPGGPDNFETVVKFCYGLPIHLTPTNVAPLRCASEFLEMTEDLEEGNLISRTESFLTMLLSSWRSSIAVLISCELLSPWADNLHIIRRCCNSIAWKASRDNHHHPNPTVPHGPGEDAPCTDRHQCWFDDIAMLGIDHFVRIVTSVRAKGVAPEIIGACIAYYAERWLPGFEGESEGRHLGRRNELQLSILSGKRNEVLGLGGFQIKDQRMMVESLVSILPQHREAVPCGFLLRLLKIAVMHSASPALVSELEKRVGMVLEDATVSDLLMPNYTCGDGGLHVGCVGEDSNMHDVDVVQRILEYFLMHEQQKHQQKGAKIAVGKLLDGYLAEVARDPNLSISKFHQLSEALPENSRTCHDGLYRAIDTYLKSHPSLVEHDRRRLCRVMDSEKLSLDACLHAAHNERLPLRTVLQVLFTEQSKMRVAIQVKDPMHSGNLGDHESNVSSTKKEIKSLKTELEGMKTKLEELQRDYLKLQQEFEKLSKQKSGVGWSSGWKKIRNSGFFNAKMDVEEIAATPQKHAQGIVRSRRVSIS